MKVVKFLLKAILWVVVVAVVALLSLPLWFGPVVKGVANVAVPKVTKTGFRVGHLWLNPYTARFELGDMQVSNPVGYSEKYAAKLGELTFDAHPLSLMSDVIHVEEITVKDVFVSVVRGGENNVDNYIQLQYNVAGGKDKYEANKTEKEEKAKVEELRAKETEQAKREDESSSEEPEKKVIIDKLLISGLKVQYGFMPIVVPVDIELKDIGRESGGATFKEASAKVWEGIRKAAGVVGDQLQTLGSMTGNAAKQTAKSVGKATGTATDAVVQTAESAGKATGKAAKAVGDGAAKALEALNDLW